MSISYQYIFLSFIILFNYYSNCLYILPLNTTYEDWGKDELVFKNFFYNKIFTELKIGEPSDTLPTFIKSGDYCSYIANYTSKIKTNYNATKSETFKNLTDYNLIYKDFYNSCLANEAISLSTNIDDYKSNLKNVNFSKFYYAPNNTKSQEMPYSSGVFGFKLQNDQNEECQSFIKDFEENNETKDSLVSFEYFEGDENDSRIVIGEYPHVYDKNLYSEVNYLKIFMNDSAVKTKGDYHLLFKEVYFYQENMINSSHKISINDVNLLESNFIFEQNMFTVPEEFFISYVIDFFEKYSGACNLTLIDNRYISYVCHKISISNADIHFHFPTIFLEHKNFTFEFTYEELLKEKNGKLYLMIALDTLNENMWGLGKIFMEKYLCTFNSKENSVGIYTSRNQNNDYSFDFLDSGIYVILILGGNILVVFGCLMYALISKCAKSSVDPTIMIESFSGTVEDLKKPMKEDNIKTGNKPKNEIEITEA